MISNLGADVSGSLNLNADLSTGFDIAGDISAAANLAVQTASGGRPAATPVGSHPPDPWVAFKFIVEIQGVTALRFKTCGSIGVDSTPDHVQPGGRNGPGDQLPPLSWKWKPVTLTRGMAKDGIALWRWIMDTVSKKRLEPHNITVTLLDDEGNPGMIWTFLKAYPTNWSVAQLDASTSGLAIETISFAHQGVTLDFPGGHYEETGKPPPAPPTPPAPATPAKPGAPGPNQKPANPAPPPANKKTADTGKPAGGSQDSGRERTEHAEEQGQTASNAAPTQAGETGGTTAGDAVDTARAAGSDSP